MATLDGYWASNRAGPGLKIVAAAPATNTFLIVALPILTGAEAYALPSSKKAVAPARKIISAAAVLVFIIVVGFLTIPLAYATEVICAVDLWNEAPIEFDARRPP